MSRDFQHKWYQAAKESQNLHIESPRLTKRNVQEERFSMEVSFFDSLFENNRQGDTSQGGIPLLGIIAVLVEFSSVSIRRTKFQGNIFDGSDGNQNGYAIQSSGADVEIYDSCFIDNDFIGFAPVQLFGATTYVVRNNFVTLNDDLLFCDFIAYSTSLNPESNDEITCIASDAIVCRL